MNRFYRIRARRSSFCLILIPILIVCCRCEAVHAGKVRKVRKVLNAETRSTKPHETRLEPQAIAQRGFPVAISSDRKRMALATAEKRLQVLDLENSRIVFNAESSELTALAFSPNGRHIAGFVGNGAIRVWNLKTGQARSIDVQKNKLPHHALTFRDDHNLISSDGRNNIVLWNLAASRISKLETNGEEIRSLAVSPEGRLLAVGHGWTPFSWNPRTGKNKTPPPGKLVIWDLKERKPIRELNGHKSHGIHDLAFSPDGKTLASCANSVILWNTTSFEQRREIKDDVELFWSVDFSPTGELIATTTLNDSFIKIWKAEGDLFHTLRASDTKFLSANFLSGTQELISSGIDGRIRQWLIPYQERPE